SYFRVDETAKTVNKIGCNGFAAHAVLKQRVVMKIDVITQVKRIGEAIGRNVPAFGDTGLHMHTVVDLHQAVEELVIHPDGILVAAKGGVERGKAFVEVDVEDCFA